MACLAGRGQWQGGEGGARLGLAAFGEVEVDEGRSQGGVAEVFGDLRQGDPFIKHVGGVTVAQSVDDDAVVTLEQTGAGKGDLEAGSRRAGGHCSFALAKALAQGGTLPATSCGRKEPFGIAMPGPEGAEALEDFPANGDLP